MLFPSILLIFFSFGSALESFYDIVEKDIDGKNVSFSQFKGKIVYIVNVASFCGYTESNYKILRDLKRYREYGLELVIFPCNQFGEQEPGSKIAINYFASTQGFEGIIMKKDDVNGAKARPTFKYLKEVTGRGDIRWNFEGKFIVDREGNVTIPGENIEAEIRKLLHFHEDL